MKPVRTKNTNLTLGAPKDWDNDKYGVCQGLPVMRNEDGYFSFWKVSWKERFAILFGKNIQLFVHSKSHPPVSLLVTEEK